MPSTAASEDRRPPSVKAHATGRWAETMFKALSARVATRWKFLSFRGAGKGEWRGVVDVLAIRKNTSAPTATELKRGDLFEIILVQIKGGSAKAPTDDDCARLQSVAKHYNATAVVLFSWVRGKQAQFFVLQSDRTWKLSSGAEIFG